MVPPEPDNDDDTSAAVAPATAAVPPAPALAEDVPCVGCGYNLRGLDSSVRCPECGLSLHISIVRHRNRRRPPPPPDPWWARQVVEGAVLSLIAFVLVAALCVAPQWMFVMPLRFTPAGKTPGRVILLCVGAAAWVVAWYSAWKLTRRPPVGEVIELRRRVRLARWPLTVYLVCPFIIPAFGESVSGPAALSLLVLFLCGVVGVAMLTGTVAGLFSRIGRGWAASEAATLAVLNAGANVFAFLLPFGHGGISALDLMLDLPVHPFGMPRALREAVRESVYHGQHSPILLGFVGLALWNVVLIARLAAAYWPFSRGPRGGVSPEGGESESAT